MIQAKTTSKVKNQAAQTIYGPIIQVAIEQFVAKKQRIIIDELAYRFLPLPVQLLIQMCKFKSVRQLLTNLSERRAPGVRGGVLCRKRFIEEKLAESLHTGIQTVVILGAGLDNLAYRIPGLATMQVYEVDLPENIDYKTTKLEKIYRGLPSHVKLVPVDFNEQKLENVLSNFGYAPDRKSFFIWEGVTQYILEESVRGIFEFLSKVEPGSRMVFTYIRKDFIEGTKFYGSESLYQRARLQKEFWRFGLHPQEIEGFIGAYSWKELEQAGTKEYKAWYLEPVGRLDPVMEIERAVYAEKVPDHAI